MKRNEPVEMEAQHGKDEVASPLPQLRPWVKPAIVEEDYSATEGGSAAVYDGVGYS